MKTETKFKLQLKKLIIQIEAISYKNYVFMNMLDILKL